MSETDWGRWEDVDFDIEKEAWNVYELIDGTLLKIRTVLVKLRRRPTIGKPGEYEYNGNFQNLLNALIHPREKGSPAKPPPPEELERLPKTPINFTTQREDWNIYRLKDNSGVKVKLVVSEILKITDKACRNQFGEPLYIVNSTNVVSPLKKF